MMNKNKYIELIDNLKVIYKDDPLLSRLVNTDEMRSIILSYLRAYEDLYKRPYITGDSGENLPQKILNQIFTGRRETEYSTLHLLLNLYEFIGFLVSLKIEMENKKEYEKLRKEMAKEKEEMDRAREKREQEIKREQRIIYMARRREEIMGIKKPRSPNGSGIFNIKVVLDQFNTIKEYEGESLDEKIEDYKHKHKHSFNQDKHFLALRQWQAIDSVFVIANELSIIKLKKPDGILNPIEYLYFFRMASAEFYELRNLTFFNLVDLPLVFPDISKRYTELTKNKDLMDLFSKRTSDKHQREYRETLNLADIAAKVREEATVLFDEKDFEKN